MKQQNDYFMNLMDRTEWRMVKGVVRVEKLDGEKDLNCEKVWKVVNGLKDGEAMGFDGAPREVWNMGKIKCSIGWQEREDKAGMMKEGGDYGGRKGG